MKVKIFDSSAISVAKRDGRTLTIIFTSGGRYQYDDIPEETIDGFWNAESAGRFYQANIRGKFNAVKVSSPQVEVEF